LKFYETTASPQNFLLKFGNWLQSYGQKTIFNIAAVYHLEFKKKFTVSNVTVIEFHILLCTKFCRHHLGFKKYLYFIIWLSSSSKLAVVYQISMKLPRFSDLMIGLEFVKIFYHLTSVAVLFCFPVPNFTEIGQSAVEYG